MVIDAGGKRIEELCSGRPFGRHECRDGRAAWVGAAPIEKTWLLDPLKPGEAPKAVFKTGPRVAVLGGTVACRVSGRTRPSF